MTDFLFQPWPWYVVGPLIGLMVPALLILTGKTFGVSSSLKHACAAVFPARIAYFRYDWKAKGLWNLTFVLGILLGGWVTWTWLTADPGTYRIALSSATVADLQALGIDDLTGLVPADLFSWSSLLTVPGFVAILGGGFLVGFGARYAGGCTSGHSITGIASLELKSLVATIGFFIGGLVSTFVLLPLLV